MYGYYILDWNATIGAYAIVQSGQPWETWSYEPYIAFTSNTSDTSRYAEPAGSRRTPTHYQLDLNYTQNFRLKNRYSFRSRPTCSTCSTSRRATTYQPAVPHSTFGYAEAYIDPRRLQLAVRFQF